MRVLVSISPRMYREIIALHISRNRPDLHVRLAPPDYAAEELASFRPHLLVHADTASITEEALVGFPLMLAVPRFGPVGSEIDTGDRDVRSKNVGLDALMLAVDGATALVAPR